MKDHVNIVMLYSSVQENGYTAARRIKQRTWGYATGCLMTRGYWTTQGPSSMPGSICLATELTYVCLWQPACFLHENIHAMTLFKSRCYLENMKRRVQPTRRGYLQHMVWMTLPYACLIPTIWTTSWGYLWVGQTI